MASGSTKYSAMSDVQEAVEKALLGEVQDEAMPDLVVDVAGESRLLAWSLYPVTHPGGHSVGAVLVVRDVTEQRAFERVRSEFVCAPPTNCARR